VSHYRDPFYKSFSDILGPEPTWLKCACGVLTSRVPCWDCDRALTAKLDAARMRGVAIATIPKRYTWAHVDALELEARVQVHDPLAEVVKRVLGATRVIFVGPSGAGKTSLACACLRERIPHGVFMTAFRLGVARSQAALGQGEPAEVDRAMSAPLLLLDEVGGEAKTATNAVRDVLFARHDADLPTWITTGFTGQQLAETYGDGALRRIIEDAYVVKLGAA
jgi:DNA replication protein DnaC